MSKELQKQVRLTKKATAPTTSAVLAAVSLLTVSLGISSAAPVEDAESATNALKTKASGGKLAESQLNTGTQDLQSRQKKYDIKGKKTPDLQSNQNKVDLEYKPKKRGGAGFKELPVTKKLDKSSPQ
jgi:hypothetical protein